MFSLDEIRPSPSRLLANRTFGSSTNLRNPVVRNRSTQAAEDGSSIFRHAIRLVTVETWNAGVP